MTDPQSAVVNRHIVDQIMCFGHDISNIVHDERLVSLHGCNGNAVAQHRHDVRSVIGLVSKWIGAVDGSTICQA